MNKFNFISKLLSCAIKKKVVPLSLGIISFAFLICLAISAWTEPNVAPPRGNVAAPLNVSGIPQVKSDKLGIATDGIDPAYGLIVGNAANGWGIKIAGNSLFEKDLSFLGEIRPQGNICNPGQILQKTSTAWGCADFVNNPVLSITNLGVSYIIYERDGTVYAENGSTGEIDYSGTDAATVIQATMDSLTNGRTWKEKVLLRGVFTISNTLTIPSFTILDLESAKLILRDNTNKNLIEINNRGNVEIQGGWLDGNKTQQTSGSGIYLSNSYKVKIIGTDFHNFKEDGINGGSALNPSYFTRVLHSYFKNNDGKGFNGKGLIDSVVIGCAAENQANDYGFYLDNSSMLFNSHSWRNYRGVGIKAGASIVKIVSCFINNNHRDGIRIEGAGSGHVIAHNQLSGNNTDNAANISSIFAYSVSKTEIFDNVINDPNCSYSINEAGVSSDNVIRDNKFLAFSAAAPIPTLGPNTKAEDNYGFITENAVLSGSFRVDLTGLKTVTIAHGLNITPAKEDCQLTVIEDTNVDDWAYDLLKIDSVNATNVVAKIYVSRASATQGAVARLSLKMGKP